MAPLSTSLFSSRGYLVCTRCVWRGVCVGVFGVCVCVRVRRCVCGMQGVRDVVCVCVRARACEQACRDVQPGYGGRV